MSDSSEKSAELFEASEPIKIPSYWRGANIQVKAAPTEPIHNSVKLSPLKKTAASDSCESGKLIIAENHNTESNASCALCGSLNDVTLQQPNCPRLCKLCTKWLIECSGKSIKASSGKHKF